MWDEVVLQAPAKLNLHLAVGRRRPDGFHDIFSLFQAVSLADTIQVSLLAQEGIELLCPLDCPPRANTMYRAAAAWLERSALPGRKSGLRIVARKQIPSGAGLGGASSDAAAVLRALALLQPGAVTDAELLEIAAATGSDVPFFLGTTCALVTGRGEYLEPVQPGAGWSAVLIWPELAIATPLAYAILDEARRSAGTIEEAVVPGPGEDCGQTVQAFHGPVKQWPFHNDFLPPILSRWPVLGSLMNRLRSSGADYVSMSGSGSTIFGIFEDSRMAARAVTALGEAGIDAKLSFPLAQWPESVYNPTQEGRAVSL